jgi:uncharacterized membrane protein
MNHHFEIILLGHLLILIGALLILSGVIRMFKPKLPKLTKDELDHILQLKEDHDASDPWVEHRDKEFQS